MNIASKTVPPTALTAALLLWMCCVMPCAAALWELQLHDGSGTGTASRYVAAGETVAVKACIPVNQGFLGWLTHTGLDLDERSLASPDLTFIMPENNVRLGAAFGAIAFAVGETDLDIPPFTSTQPKLTLPSQAEEASFAVRANTTWTIRATTDPTAPLPDDDEPDATLPDWLTILNGGGYGTAEVRFRTTDYPPHTSTPETAGAGRTTDADKPLPRTAYLILQPAATTLAPVCIAVTQLPPEAKPGFYYDIWNNVATLSLFIPPPEGYADLEIPAVTPDGYPVGAIGPRPFQESASLQSIALPRGITIIHEAAFKGCHALHDVILPPTLREIRAQAFAACTSLEELALQNTALQYIHDGAFTDCDSLASLNFPSSLLAIGSEAFCRCTRLAPGMLPQKLEAIGDAAFLQCGATSFSVSAYNETFRAIDGAVFDKKSRTLIAYPPNATASHFSFPENTRSIAPYAFAHCRQLKTISFNDAQDLAVIGDAAFLNNTGLTHIQLPLAIDTIASRAFAGCTELQTIVASDTAPAIAADAFDGCGQLHSFYFYGPPPLFDTSQDLSPAPQKTIYACREMGWTNGDVFAGCTVNAAPQAAFFACSVANGIPNAFFVEGWPVNACVFPYGINVFAKWTAAYGITLSQEQQTANPLAFTMPRNSAVTLEASYITPSFNLTLYHAKLADAQKNATFPANTPLRAVADMPPGIPFSCWVSDSLHLAGTQFTRHYIDFLMPFANTALYAATVSPDIRQALAFDGTFTTYGDDFWKQNTTQFRSAPAAASTSGRHSILATAANGPANLAFFAKLSASSTSSAKLICRLDGRDTGIAVTHEINAWTPFSIVIPEGNHNIEWLLINPDADATAFIDSVQAFPAGKKRKLAVRNSQGSGDYEPGTVICLSADSFPGMGFASWTAAFLDYTPEELASPDITFIMPNNDAIIIANYETARLAVAPKGGTESAQEYAYVMASAQSGPIPLTISANAPWTTAVSDDWLAVSPESATADADAVLSIAPNTASAPRTATVTFTAESGLRLVLSLTQQPPAYTGFLHNVWDDDAVITAFIHDGSQKPVVIPATLDGITVTRLQDGIFQQATDITAFQAEDGHAVVKTRDGILYSRNMTTLIAYPPAATALAVEIPGSVSLIADRAFANAQKLQTLTLPASITPLVFQTLAFDGCTDAITAFETTSDHPTMTAVNGILFSHDLSVLYAYPPGRADCTYAIPDGTERIASCAFRNARKLNQLEFPVSLEAIAATPYINMDDCLRFLIFHGNRPDIASPPPPNAIIYIRPDTQPKGAWEAFLEKAGTHYEYFLPDAELKVVSAPDVIAYDNQFSIYFEVSTTAAEWRVSRVSLGPDDPVWMPCDVTTDNTWINLDWALDDYPFNLTDSNRTQTLWFTADGCLPQTVAVTQLCSQETLNQNIEPASDGWNALPILCQPFMDTIQPVLNLAPFVFDKRSLTYRRALPHDVTAGATLWIYITPQIRKILPFTPIVGQKIHVQALPETFGWHAVGIAVTDGIQPQEWNRTYDNAWQWNGKNFRPLPVNEPLDYGNSYFLHAPFNNKIP